MNRARFRATAFLRKVAESKSFKEEEILQCLFFQTAGERVFRKGRNERENMSVWFVK